MGTVTNFRPHVGLDTSNPPVGVVVYDQDADAPGPVVLDRPLAHRLHRYLVAVRPYQGDLIQFDADVAELARQTGTGR